MQLLQMQNICKSFSGVQVLKDVSLTLEQGEIHALLGENGAGKSTLMNILTGVLPADSGTVTFDGAPLQNATVHKTEALGIAFVHQELNLFNDLKVYENIFLTREYQKKFGMLDKRAMIKRSKELFESLGVDISPTAVVSSLSTSQKQLLEISKALFFNAKLLILDEPTTALNNEEIEHLFTILRRLKQEGKTFIFISHKMPEIFAISDRYTVLRNGEYIASGKISETTPEDVTRLMVGKTFSDGEIYRGRKLGEEVLRLDKLSGPGFSDVSLSVRRGEVLGLTGLQGAGSSELLSCMFGVTERQSGGIQYFGKQARHGIHGAMLDKVAMLPANRKENSLVPDLSILENEYLSEHVLSGKHQHISKRKELEKYERLKKLLEIKAVSPDDAVTSLSGGNQQKVFLARWLNTEAEILLLDNPTQGIDVGAKAEIYRLILELAEQGKTILINTLEIPELKKVADRCAIFYNGHLSKILPHEEIDEQTVMLYSTNAIPSTEVDHNG